MTQNREIAEIILAQMREVGFKPYNIEYGDSYFIFEMGKDSVVHFRLKGVMKHWAFGMWIDSSILHDGTREKEKDTPFDQRNKVIRLFCQYDTQIDKFKPSRSDLLWEMDAEDWMTIGQHRYSFYGMEEMLKMIRRHPLLCYYGLCGSTYRLYTGRSFLWYFLKNEGRELLEKLVFALQYAWCVPYTYAKCWIAGKAKCVDHIQVVNFEKEHPGWRTSSKLQVHTWFTKQATEAEESAWANRWFKKNDYGKFGYYNYITCIEPFRKVGRDGCFRFH